MHRRDASAADQPPDQVASAAFGVEVDGRGRAFAPVQHDLHIERLAEMTGLGAEKHEHVALALEPDSRHLGDVWDQPDAAYCRGGRDGDAVRLVIERYVAG